jgi:hypothetical protein
VQRDVLHSGVFLYWLRWRNLTICFERTDYWMNPTEYGKSRQIIKGSGQIPPQTRQILPSLGQINVAAVSNANNTTLITCFHQPKTNKTTDNYLIFNKK